MNINYTLFAQLVAFLLFIWFTAKFIWPPVIRAIEERQAKIAEGLKAAERAKDELSTALKKVDAELAASRARTSELRADAEKQAAGLIDEARTEGARILAAARKAAEQEAALAAQRARDSLREQVASLSVAGAERILRREIDAGKHAEMLANLKNELR